MSSDSLRERPLIALFPALGLLVFFALPAVAISPPPYERVRAKFLDLSIVLEAVS